MCGGLPTEEAVGQTMSFKFLEVSSNKIIWTVKQTREGMLHAAVVLLGGCRRGRVLPASEKRQCKLSLTAFYYCFAGPNNAYHALVFDPRRFFCVIL